MRALIALAAVTAAANAETVPLPDAGWKAAWAFRDTCLKTRGAGAEAAIAAILARPDATEGPSLPAYGDGKPMRSFADKEVEYIVRYGKKTAYGCFVALKGDSALAESARNAISGFDGLTVKPLKPSKKLAYEWTFAGSKDSIRLVPSSDIGSILINLEVN